MAYLKVTGFKRGRGIWIKSPDMSSDMVPAWGYLLSWPTSGHYFKREDAVQCTDVLDSGAVSVIHKLWAESWLGLCVTAPVLPQVGPGVIRAWRGQTPRCSIPHSEQQGTEDEGGGGGTLGLVPWTDYTTRQLGNKQGKLQHHSIGKQSPWSFGVTACLTLSECV